jgi:iron complex transport system ATP-binding protein
MPEPDSSLLLEHVTAGYGERPVVRDVTLGVRAGEVVGLVGPNGSGKTTLIRVASRTLRPIDGTVKVNGLDPYAIPAREAARLVAVVPQELVPAFSFTALEITLTGRAPHRRWWGRNGSDDWPRVRNAMEATGVAELADRPFEELSGGERQRVVLAQALAQDAPVLLLDEPTTHLDIHHMLEILRIVRELAVTRQRAVLAIFHDLNLAAAACDRVCALHRGSLVAEGPAEDVLTPAFLQEVYGVEARVVPDPVTGRPMVSLGALVWPVSPLEEGPMSGSRALLQP